MTKWTEEEIEILKEHYLKTSWDELLKILPNRTYNGIMHKANRLGLYRKSYDQTKSLRWTDEEIKILKEYYPTASWDELFELLPNHTKGAITSKAKDYNDLKRLRCGYWNKEEDNIIKEHYPMAYWEDLHKLLPNRTHWGITTRASYLKVKRIRNEDPKIWKYYEDAVLKKYYETASWERILELLPFRNQRGIIHRANRLDLYRKLNDKFVYFIFDVKSEAVKIGKTNNIFRRFRSFQIAHPNILELLATYPENIERKLHKLFKKYHIRGEWFEYSEEIKEWIDKHCNTENSENIILLNKFNKNTKSWI
jgi:hypothetical protein